MWKMETNKRCSKYFLISDFFILGPRIPEKIFISTKSSAGRSSSGEHLQTLVLFFSVFNIRIQYNISITIRSNWAKNENFSKRTKHLISFLILLSLQSDELYTINIRLQRYQIRKLELNSFFVHVFEEILQWLF